ncbi:carbonic anhydrase [Cokeromyces recurvatus]|uniref:carbonic anhydrase n=1 Tax=Cokeromyces recurvatus TaxID=90255 RepID=UPI00221E9716|nr:carbonic anhydrase [Cokeromyces recurvatus]KAI7899045.1 carbonic anhydrase [Cokeromyces recurvatus]
MTTELDDELLSMEVIDNGNKVIAGSQSGALYSWNWDGWKESRRKWLGHPSSVDAMCKLDEQVICTGGNDGLLRMITVLPQYGFEGILGDHGEDFPIECIKLDHKQKYLASCGHDLKLKFWNIEFLFKGDNSKKEKRKWIVIDDDKNKEKYATPRFTKHTMNKFDPEDTNLDGILANNKKWAEEVMKEDPAFLKNIALKQQPKILWIGCSDSRVPANVVTSLPPGEVFVHRNIANVVTHADLNCLSVLQYAVEVLKVEHIIVCGHYNCGGVTAALGHQQYGLIDNWLRSIKDVYRLYKDELEAIQDEEKRLYRLIELNAINSAKNVCHSTIVQNAWERGQKLTVHAWAFNIETGIAKRLEWMAKDRNKVDPIYITTE